MGRLTDLIGWLSPQWALRRETARKRLQVLQAYDIATDSHLRRRVRDLGSGTATVERAGTRIRDYARHVERESPLGVAVIRHLAYQTMACTITPMVRRTARRNGLPVLADETNQALADAWERWAPHAELSGLVPYDQVCDIAGRAWVRDGEFYGQLLLGSGRYPYRSDVPLALALLEGDYLDLDYTEETERRRIIQAVELGAGQQIRAFHFYREHPGDRFYRAAGLTRVRIPVEQVLALRHLPRAGMVRGISQLAAVLTSIEDGQEYLDAERVAAKFSACIGVAIERSTDFAEASISNLSGERSYTFQPGMTFTDLAPGEKVVSVGMNRPNAQMADYLLALGRWVAVGTSSNYSTITGDYSGTYSSQRQMMVEARPYHLRQHAIGVSVWHRPLWRAFVQAAVLTGTVPLRGIDESSLFAADFVPPPQPWVDPQKEATADELAVRAGFESRQGVVRRRGGDVRRIDAERASDPRPGAQAPAAPQSGDQGDAAQNG